MLPGFDGLLKAARAQFPFHRYLLDSKQFRAGECCLRACEVPCSSLGTTNTNNNGCVEHPTLSDLLIAFSQFLPFLTIVATINFRAYPDMEVTGSQPRTPSL